LEKRAEHFAPRLEQWVARHNLEESLKTVSTLLDDLVGEPVGEDLSEA
jgi:hypothetical protein